jgi:hypothetical protein
MPKRGKPRAGQAKGRGARRPTPPSAAGKGAAKKGAASDLWRRPIDLSPELTMRLLHGLAENHRRRLEVFAREGDRVSMHKLLAVTGDSDIRVLSYFQGALSRKIRRLLADREKKMHVIGWDYAATKWDDEHAMIIDGICYVTPATRDSLRQCLKCAPAPAASP